MGTAATAEWQACRLVEQSSLGVDRIESDRCGREVRDKPRPLPGEAIERRCRQPSANEHSRGCAGDDWRLEVACVEAVDQSIPMSQATYPQDRFEAEHERRQRARHRGFTDDVCFVWYCPGGQGAGDLGERQAYAFSQLCAGKRDAVVMAVDRQIDVNGYDREPRATAGAERLEDRIPRQTRQRHVTADRCHRRRPAAGGPLQLRHQARRHLQGNHLRRVERDGFSHRATVRPVVVTRRQPDQVAEPSDERCEGSGQRPCLEHARRLRRSTHGFSPAPAPPRA